LLDIFRSKQRSLYVPDRGFFPVLSNTTLGMNSVDRQLPRIVKLTAPRECDARVFLSQIDCGVAVHARRMRIAGGCR